MFNLSSIYCARKSLNHRLSKNTKSVLTQTYTKQNINKHQTQNFRRINPFSITPVIKAHMARTRWYCGPFRRFINTGFLKVLKKKKGMDRSNIKKKYIYKCMTANTRAIEQHAAHTTDQLTSPTS